jgi:hypothetical protein
VGAEGAERDGRGAVDAADGPEGDGHCVRGRGGSSWERCCWGPGAMLSGKLRIGKYPFPCFSSRTELLPRTAMFWSFNECLPFRSHCCLSSSLELTEKIRWVFWVFCSASKNGSKVSISKKVSVIRPDSSYDGQLVPLSVMLKEHERFTYLKESLAT